MKMRKGQTAMEYLMTYGWAILIIMVVLAVLFYLGVLNPSGMTPSQCTFPPGFTCVTNKLKTNGFLYLIVGQGTGKNIRIMGINCTQNTSLTFPTDGRILWTSPNNITVASGSQVTLANPGATDFTNTTTCNLANGSPVATTLSPMPIGSIYNGRVYINYTEIDTGLTRVIVGTYTAKYEP